MPLFSFSKCKRWAGGAEFILDWSRGTEEGKHLSVIKSRFGCTLSGIGQTQEMFHFLTCTANCWISKVSHLQNADNLWLSEIRKHNPNFMKDFWNYARNCRYSLMCWYYPSFFLQAEIIQYHRMGQTSRQLEELLEDSGERQSSRCFTVNWLCVNYSLSFSCSFNSKQFMCKEFII